MTMLGASSLGRPVRRFVLTLIRQLPRLRSISQHGPYLASPRARRFENQVTAIGRPAGTLVASGVARELDKLMAHDVHHVNIVIPTGAPPAKCEQLSIW